MSSLADFMERFFRLGVDLSSLPALLNYTSLDADGRRPRSAGFSDQAQDNDGEADRTNSSLSRGPSVNQTRKSPCPQKGPGNRSDRKMWNPVWLSNAVLWGFFFLFAGLFFMVLALWFYSETHNGLMNGSEGLHYIWTYLPTAS